MVFFEVFTPFPQCTYPFLPSNSSDPDNCDLTFAGAFPAHARALRAFGVVWSLGLLAASASELLGNTALSVERSRRRGQRTSWLREWWAMRTFKGRALAALTVLLAVNVVRAIDIRGSAGLIPVALELALDQLGVILSALIGALYTMSVTGVVMNRRRARRRVALHMSAGVAAFLALGMPLFVVVFAILDGLPGKAGAIVFACRMVVLGFYTTAAGAIASMYTLPEWRRVLFPTDVLPHTAPPEALRSSVGLVAGAGSAEVAGSTTAPSQPWTSGASDSDSTKMARSTARGPARGAKDHASVMHLDGSSASVAQDLLFSAPAVPPAPAPHPNGPIRIFSVSNSMEFSVHARDSLSIFSSSAQPRLEPLRPPFPVTLPPFPASLPSPACDSQLLSSSTPVPSATDVQLSAAEQLSATEASAADQQLSVPDGAALAVSGVSNPPVPPLPALRGFPTTDTVSTDGASQRTYAGGSEIYGFVRAPAPQLRRLPPTAATEHMSANLRGRVSGVVLRIMAVSIMINFFLCAGGIAIAVLGAVSFAAEHPASLTVTSVTPVAFWTSFNMIVTFWTLPLLMLLVISNGAMAVIPLKIFGAVATTCCGAPPPQPLRRGYSRRRRLSGSARVAAPVSTTARGVEASPVQASTAGIPLVTPVRGRAAAVGIAACSDSAAEAESRATPAPQGQLPGITTPPRPRIALPAASIVVSEQLTPIAEERDASSDFSRSEMGTAALRY